MSSRLPDAAPGWTPPPLSTVVAAQTRALKAARDALDQSPEAPAAARRLARALHVYADRHRLRAIVEAAEAVEHAGAENLADALDHLLTETELTFTPRAAAEPAVLVVENDRLLAEVFESALRDSGQQVVTVRTAGEAQEALSSRPISVIVLALKLPDGDGRNLLLSVKSSSDHGLVGVIVTSEFRDELVREECLALGADAYFEKPVNATDIETACLALVQRSQINQAPRSDPITGLPSHAEFCARYASAMSLVEAGGHHASLALLDFSDGARSTHSNPLDVQVALSAVARMLRDSDIVGRWSTQQIVALLPSTDYRAAIAAVQKVTEEVRAGQFRSPSGDVVQFNVAASVIPLAYGTDVRDAVRDAQRVLSLAVAPTSGVITGRRTQGVPTVVVTERESVPQTVARL